MEDLEKLREAFDSANDFLSPILKREGTQDARGPSVVETLSGRLPFHDSGSSSARVRIIRHALDILFKVHTALTAPIKNDVPNQSGTEMRGTIEDAKQRRALHTLLDLISIEGIYPSLSQGVGIPLEKRIISILPVGVVAKQVPLSAERRTNQEELLQHILTTLINILFDDRPGLQQIIRGRILSEILSGIAELAFNSQISGADEKSKYRSIFERILEGTATPILLQTLSAFLRPDTAPWFRTSISSQLACIPLREDGVLQTIIFVASQLAPSLGHAGQIPSSNGPPITVQAIMQISKLLSSVPSAMDSTVYFHNIAPKLLALIDGDDRDLKRTAAYVIGNGILGKRLYGAPGTIGHSIFVEPAFKAITGTLDDSARFWLRRYSHSCNPESCCDTKATIQESTIVGESELLLSLERLSSMSLQHPNPGLVKRLVRPILLPLWGLACYAEEQGKSAWYNKSFTLLQTYFGVSAGLDSLKKIVDNLLWDGDSTWTYGSEENGGISLRKRHGYDFNLVQFLDSLDKRANKFAKLLGSDPRSEARIGDVFLYVSEMWLVTPLPSRTFTRFEIPDPESVRQKLVSTRITERLLEIFKDTLSRNPTRVLELVDQLIASELNRAIEGVSEAKQQNAGGSLTSLSNIVVSDEKSTAQVDQTDSTEALLAALSLLSTILASPSFSTSKDVFPVLNSIKGRLDQLIQYLPTSLSQSASTASMLLEIQLVPSEGQKESKAALLRKSDLETYHQALSNISSPLVPVQAEGLSLLSDLVKKSSPILDIPSTLSLLLSLLMGNSEAATKEEFVYLNIIILIGTLASKHPRTVIATLMEYYVDRSEDRTVDQRLKIGESLLHTIQNLGKALVDEIAQVIGEGMIAVGGRRGYKPKAQKERKIRLEKERRQKEREERGSVMPPGWKISTPLRSKPESGPELESDSDLEAPEQAEHSSEILFGWAVGATSDLEPDDLRIRASAISILASAIQTNLLALGPSIASSAVDLSLSILTLEPGPESAILRRASSVLLLDIVKAMDTARETQRNGNLGFGFSLIDTQRNISGPCDGDTSHRGPTTIGNIPSMVRTLAFVLSEETDGITRGHIRLLIENLEAWMEKSLLFGIGVHTNKAFGESLGDEPRLELGDRLAGLSVDPLAGKDKRVGLRIEEIE